jgi:hypothetical protein
MRLGFCYQVIDRKRFIAYGSSIKFKFLQPHLSLLNFQSLLVPFFPKPLTAVFDTMRKAEKKIGRQTVSDLKEVAMSTFGYRKRVFLASISTGHTSYILTEVESSRGGEYKWAIVC